MISSKTIYTGTTLILAKKTLPKKFKPSSIYNLQSIIYTGTTLILAILDEGQLWVANVGDSRGVFGNRWLSLSLSE